eukprot:COSAG01_NODE_1027_length_12036_cov_4.718857_5_plen_517_part_00
MSLLSRLPAPQHFTGQSAGPAAAAPAAAAAVGSRPAVKQPPPYGRRQGFVPRTVDDFGDGGAFPEVHVAQYPLNMGRKRDKRSKTVGMTVDKDGKANFQAIVMAGGQGGSSRPGTTVHARYQDLVPKDPGQEGDLSRPDDKDLADTAQETQAAMDKIIGGKVAASHVTNVGNGQRKEQYLRYTPAHAQAGGAKQRVIHMMEMPKDPMEPPQFKHKRVPGGPPSPPVPVMHSPPRKLTVKDQQEWKIPPCISNWKNAKGYTIPLDKRLAADGRDTQETTINDKFAKLSESLYVAERVAREDINKRAEASRKVALKKSEEKDAQLRRLAQRVVEEKQHMAAEAEEEDEGAAEGRRQRDELRYERKRERQRDYNIAMAAPEKRSKLMRDRDRDISEQIALGQASTGKQEMEYDQRLYNQSEGMTSGFGAEDSYNVYDKPLFKPNAQIYKASQQKEDFDTDGLIDALKKGKGGGEAARPTSRHAPRNKPVQFEKEQEAGAGGGGADPFGLDEFLASAKNG